MKKGKFIVFEGIDACGKGTQIKNVASYLFDLDKSMHIFLTREPTKISPYGEQVRELLKKSKDIKKDQSKFTELYVKDRYFHVKHQILPMLKTGCIVLSDRYKHSTFAYQLAQGADIDFLLRKHKGLPVPDLTLIIDIAPKESLKRLDKISSKKEVFERLDFLEKVRENYLKMNEIFPNENIAIIEGTGTQNSVFGRIKREIEKII